MPWLFSTRRPDVVGLAGDRDVAELRVHHLLELERDAVDERVVDLVERQRRVLAPQHAPLDVGQQQARLRHDEREQQDRVAQHLLRQVLGVGVLEVVQQPEQLQEHLGGLAALHRVGDLADQPAHGAVADAVVDGLELLVDQERQQVAAPHFPVDDLAHRVERRVRQARELDEVEQQQVQVLEGLAQQREGGLGHRVAHELLDVGVEALLGVQVGLDVAVEAREVHLLLAQDRGGQLDHPQQGVVDEPQLLRPVARRHRARLTVGQRLGADPEEALEAPQPHLELEELRRLPGHGDLVREAPELGAEQLGARFGRAAPQVVSAVPRHRDGL